MRTVSNNKKLVTGILLLFLVIVCYFTVRQFAVDKIFLEKDLKCFDTITQTERLVTVKGTYYRCILREDYFDGTVSIEGLCQSTRVFLFDKNGETPFFIDEYGQPIGRLRQSNMFQNIAIDGNEYSIVFNGNPPNLSQ